jgi:hypothetical protein
MQGGIIVEFHEKMSETKVKLLIVSGSSNLSFIRSQMKGLIRY